MNLPLERFFSSPVYAVVGVSNNREKYGNIVYRYLRNKKFPVYPVHPGHSSVEGDRCYPDVSSLPDTVKSIVLVVPPRVTETVVQECYVKGITGIWMQEGSESLQAIQFATSHDIATVYDACIMVMLGPVREFGDLEQWLDRAVKIFHE